MEIFSYAMQMELDGKSFYEEEAEKTRDDNIAVILRFLAKEEQKHFEILDKFKQGSPELPESSLIEDVKNVFQSMREKKESFVEDKDTLNDVLSKALALEDKSIEFYKENAEASDDSDQIDVFTLLIKHETRHYSLLSSMIEFYEAPYQWLEQAEFTKTDDY